MNGHYSLTAVFVPITECTPGVEQVELPPERRRRVVVLVDESSTLAAVDYSRMLSEPGK